jgi:hypothetical protein
MTEKVNSIGFNCGEYGGRNSSLCPENMRAIGSVVLILWTHFKGPLFTHLRHQSTSELLVIYGSHSCQGPEHCMQGGRGSSWEAVTRIWEFGNEYQSDSRDISML